MNLSNFLKENETPNTRAYEHALDLAYLFVNEMDRQGLSKKELAEKMGVSQSRLSNLLNTQPNMTLLLRCRWWNLAGKPQRRFPG